MKGNPIETVGDLPVVGAQAPDFVLVSREMEEVSLEAFSGKRKILNIFPSLDTAVCANSVRKFNEKVASQGNVVVINISKDLPFAQDRFCTAEGIENVTTLSAFIGSFGRDYGVEITTGPIKGLFCRAIVVLDESNKVVYTQLVPEIAQDPDYDSALGNL